MLKNCILPVNYNYPVSQTCGEIICENLEEFIINCKLCKLKIFEFEEFIQHFKNAHLDGTSKNQSNDPIENDQEYTQSDERIIQFKVTEADEYKNSEQIKNETRDNESIEYLWKTDSNEPFGDYTDEDTKTDDKEWQEVEEEQNSILMKKSRKPKELSCKICNKKYADSRRLQLHITLAHLREKPFKCSTCDQAFAREQLLKNHIRLKHIGFECPTCHKKFTRKQHLQRHIVLHSDTKEFVCNEDKCCKAFATKDLLKRHQIYHTKEIFICEECGHKCRNREALNVHKRNHTGEKPFGCQLCNSRFGSKALLTEHMASHETERRHVCDVCGKSFNRPKALYHHKHLHLGVKKFVCKICGQAYAQAAGLSAHTRKHKEDLASFTSDALSAKNSNKIKDFYSF